MHGGYSIGHSLRKKKRRRDRNNTGDPLFTNRGKPVSEKWKPVWIWLQSLGRTEIVEAPEITAWLDSNMEYAEEIRQQHTNGVLVAYVQKCHQRLITGRYNKVEDHKIHALPVERPVRLPRLPRLPGSHPNDNRSAGGWSGLKPRSGGQENPCQLQLRQQATQKAMPAVKTIKYERGEDMVDEASVLDPQTWREQWRSLLNMKKNDSEVELGSECKAEQPQGTSLPPGSFEQPMSSYNPEGPDKGVSIQEEKESSLLLLDKMDTHTRFELILNLEARLKDTLSKCKEAASQGLCTQ